MPNELIKCTRAVRIYTWKGSEHDVSSGMFKNIFTDFLVPRLWSAGGQCRLIPLIGTDMRNLYCKRLGSFTRRPSAVGFLRVLKESTKLLTRLSFHRAEMGLHVPRQVR